MFPVPNSVAKCQSCGEELSLRIEPGDPASYGVSQKCPKCGGNMVVTPLVHYGPGHEEEEEMKNY